MTTSAGPPDRNFTMPKVAMTSARLAGSVICRRRSTAASMCSEADVRSPGDPDHARCSWIAPEPGLVPGFFQRSLAQVLDAPQVHPAVGGQSEEDPGPVATRPGGRDGLFEKGSRPDHIAGLEVVLGRLDRSSAESIDVGDGRQAAGELTELRGRVRGASGAGMTGGSVERDGDRGIGTRRRQREVPRALLGSSTWSARRRCTRRRSAALADP
jgi:hypothetical protein